MCEEFFFLVYSRTMLHCTEFDYFYMILPDCDVYQYLYKNSCDVNV